MNVKRVAINFVAIACIAAGIVGLILFGSNQILGSELSKYEYSIDMGEDLRELEIKEDFGDVEINWVIDNKQMIELKGRAPDEVIKKIGEFEVRNGKLVLNYVNPQDKGWFQINFGFQSQSRNHEVIIHATEDMVLDRLASKQSAGAFHMSGGQVKRLEAASSFGGVSVSKLKGDFAKLTSDAGEVKANSVDAEIQAHSSFGSIELLNTRKPLQVHAESGSIEIDQLEPHAIDAKSEFGSIDVRISPEFDGRYDLRTEFGSTEAPESKNRSDMLIKARTEAGSIKIVEK